MTERLTLLDPAVLSRLSAAVLRARSLVVGNFSGIHASPHRGASVEFLEHKRYSPGDEIKHIDWKLLARSDRYYVKQFENETNLRAVLVMDASASMAYGPAGPTKFDFARTTAAALAYLLLSQSDAVGVLSRSRTGRLYVPPRSGMAHYRAVGAALEACRPDGDGTWLDELVELGGSLQRRGMFIILSDLFVDPEAALSALKLLRHRRHDVIVMHVLHPWEVEFPFRDLTLFSDMERSGRRLLADPRACREAYLGELDKLCDFFRQEITGLEMDYVLLRSDAALEQALAHYLARREARAAKLRT